MDEMRCVQNHLGIRHLPLEIKMLTKSFSAHLDSEFIQVFGVVIKLQHSNNVSDHKCHSVIECTRFLEHWLFLNSQ